MRSQESNISCAKATTTCLLPLAYSWTWESWYPGLVWTLQTPSTDSVHSSRPDPMSIVDTCQTSSQHSGTGCAHSAWHSAAVLMSLCLERSSRIRITFVVFWSHPPLPRRQMRSHDICTKRH